MKRYLTHPVLIKFLRLTLVSLCFIVVVALLSLVYGFIAHGVFTLRYIFDANFLAASILIVIGIALMFFPTILTMLNDKLLDRSTYVEKSHDKRENRQQKARMILWIGLFCMILTGLIQLLLSVII